MIRQNINFHRAIDSFERDFSVKKIGDLTGSSSLHTCVCREAIGQHRGGTRYTDNLETLPGLRRARESGARAPKEK